MAVAAGGGYVYVAGMVGDTLGTPVPGTTPGGVDGFLAQVDASGATDVDAPARHVRRRAARGASPPTPPATRRSPASPPVISSRRTPGDKDVVVARFDPAGAMTLHDQLGHDRQRQGRDASRSTAPATPTSSGFSDGNFETNIGNFDALLIKYGPGLTRLWARQFGTTESDGADAFAEGNVFLATRGSTDLGLGLHDGQHARRRRRPGTATCS